MSNRTIGEAATDGDTDRPINELEEELGLSKVTIEELIKAGLGTVDRLIRMGKSRKYPDNLAFVSSIGDRNEVELFINEEIVPVGNLEADSKPLVQQDLRKVLGRSRERSRSSQHCRHARRHRSSHSSKSRSSGSRSSSCSRLAKISQTARKLPRAHKYVLPKLGSEKSKKVKATDISVEEFFAYNLRLALRLARTVTGDWRAK